MNRTGEKSGGQFVSNTQRRDSRAHALVPLVNRVIVYKHRLDLYSAQETEVIDGAIVYVEGDSGLF